jgi:hypothetical protein
VFESSDAAIIACKKIVDDYLREAQEPGMTAEQLYASYVLFGEDPYITGQTRHSLNGYAKPTESALSRFVD